MLARMWNTAIMLTVLAMVLALGSGFCAWYVVDGPSKSLYYLTFRGTSYGYHSYYGGDDVGNLMDVIIGMMILWIVAGLVFIGMCLRESRILATLLGLLLIVVPAVIPIYFALSVAGDIRSDYDIPVNDFAGRSLNEAGTSYVYGPRIGWYLCAVAAVIQAACAIQLILPYRPVLKKKEKIGPLGE